MLNMIDVSGLPAKVLYLRKTNRKMMKGWETGEQEDLVVKSQLRFGHLQANLKTFTTNDILLAGMCFRYPR